MKRAAVVAFVGAIAGLMAWPTVAAARPSYFATFTTIYGLSPGQDLYACGVCHRRWEGTGARNPYGTAVEQQLYVGKTITDAILDVAGDDTDLDGFANGDEIAVSSTLPGYSCSNYNLVINPPPNFQSLITPGVPSCLEPQDVLVAPTDVAFVTQVNKVGAASVQVVNNGTDFPITVSNYELLPGSNPALGVSGPALPLVIAVGQTASIDLSFSPTITVFASGTLRITSDDPDEPSIDIPLSGISFVKNLAPAADRAACFKEAERRFATYGRTHLKEWGRCYLDELRGVACDGGRRDQRIAQAGAKLRATIGGAKDRKCSGKGLTPTRLDLPPTCGAPCASITVDSISAWADCLVCRQEAATQTMLEAAVGSSPPDLPLNLLSTSAHRCNRSLLKGAHTGIRRTQKLLADCRLANVTATTPVDCDATLAGDVGTLAQTVDGLLGRCSDTTDMLGCRFEMMPDPQCLGAMATSLGADAVGAVFDTND